MYRELKSAEALRQKAKERQAKYYAANKARLNADKREARALLNNSRKGGELQEQAVIEFPEPHVVQVARPVPVPVPVPAAVSSADFASLQWVIDKFNSAPFASKATRRVYIDSAKHLAKLFKIENFIDFINDAQSVPKFKLLNKNINTTKNNIQAVLKIIDTFTEFAPYINANAKEVFDDYFQALKADSIINTTNKKQNAIPSIESFIDKIRDKYGVKSKPYILLSIYDEVEGLRDDLKKLPIVQSAGSPSDNWLHVPQAGRLVLNIGMHKTSKKNGGINKELSPRLSGLVRAYLADNRAVNGTLFGAAGLGTYVTRLLKDLDINLGANSDKGINLIRKMVINKHDLTNKTTDERVQIAKQSKHSVNTQTTAYLRHTIPTTPKRRPTLRSQTKKK